MSCKPGKHKFKARYDTIYSSLMEELAEKARTGGGKIDVNGMPWQSGERSLKEKRYVHDVCVKCGDTIKRDNHG